MYKLEVNASTHYQITISNNLDGFTCAVNPIVSGNKIAIVTDSNVASLYPHALDGYFKDKTVYNYVIPSGESSKCKEVYFDLLERLAGDGFNRTDTVIAFGGGVVGDLAGFVASTYMRGINLIQVPTTVLAAVDSSVGGKTAINLGSGKNLVGAFYQPSAVYINTGFFRTLPEREIKSGMGEVVKYAFLSKSVTAEMIEKGATEDIVYECLKIKSTIVEHDEKEGGERALLNLGHTVGHAIESLSHYAYSHGECVAKGIAYSLLVSKRLYGLDNDKYCAMQNLLASAQLDLTCPYSVAELIAQIAHDKKSNGKAIKFVTLKDIGEPEIELIDFDKLKDYLN